MNILVGTAGFVLQRPGSWSVRGKPGSHNRSSPRKEGLRPCAGRERSHDHHNFALVSQRLDITGKNAPLVRRAVHLPGDYIAALVRWLRTSREEGKTHRESHFIPVPMA